MPVNRSAPESLFGADKPEYETADGGAGDLPIEQDKVRIARQPEDGERYRHDDLASAAYDGHENTPTVLLPSHAHYGDRAGGGECPHLRLCARG